ncbi:DinI-like family protein [Orbus wheelerorum]|uniref:DinI-like family protein n=1 Tax=Orbus wheelerorum TaxID=3074111 RepID=UPI00370D628D
MLRVDILLSKDDNVPPKIIDALQIELEKQIVSLHSDAIVRVRVSSSKNIDVSGCTKEEKQTVLAIIENVFTSEDWLPE